MYYIGIDIGGTNIACGIVDEDCRIVASAKVKTNAPRPYEEILGAIKRSVRAACEQAGIKPSDAESIGIGCPGTCNRDSGTVEYSNNLGFVNAPVGYRGGVRAQDISRQRRERGGFRRVCRGSGKGQQKRRGHYPWNGRRLGDNY